ncbi:hypothetical protein H7I76_08700 [Mycolicibacterium vaccae]|nr:hypothetical protein [Mycolicibacterium vaccae]
MQDDNLYGLGDEELMTVQGLDDVADYGALYQSPDGSLFQLQGSTADWRTAPMRYPAR